MEQLNKLIQPSRSRDIEKILYAGGYALVTNSLYGVRKPCDNPNDLEDGMGVSLLKLFDKEVVMIGKTNPDILIGYKTLPVREACKECDGKGEVEREYNGHYMDADCPVCNGYNSCGYNPLDTVYINQGEKYYSAKQLDYILQVFGEMEYGTCGDYLYLKKGEYDCIINTCNVDDKVVNIKIINL